MKWSKSIDSIIAKEGFDPKMGARPIERKIEELISKEVSKMVLIENLEKGDVVSISKGRGDNLLKFTVKKKL